MKKNLNFFIISSVFFGLGFITCLNDLLTPILKSVFMLNYYQANLVAFSFFAAYFFGGLLYFVGTLLGIKFFVDLGYKGLIILGLILSGFGCLLFIPAGIYKSYYIFLVGLFSIGFGFAFLQISINPLALISGEPQTAASRLNLAQGFNSLATALAPILGVFFFYKLLDVPHNHDNLKYPYIVFCLLFLFGAYLIKKHLNTHEKHYSTEELSKPYAFNHLNLVFGALAIFCYVGSEVSIGTNFISYAKSPQALSLSESVAGKLLAFYWGGTMIGRFLGGIALGNHKKLKKFIYMSIIAISLTYLILFLTGLKDISLSYYVAYEVLALLLLLAAKNSRISLLLFALMNIINLIIGASLHNSWIAIWAVLSVGIFNSVMFPNIFDLATANLGKYKEQGASILIMMILGGAILPIIHGHFADIFGIVPSFYVPVFGYVYIMFYAMFYSKKTVNWIK
jgi:FHS family L-fucose permease-like MFS transporter